MIEARSEHAKIAERFSGYGDPPTDPAMAQVFATLYVGEQLERIANILGELLPR